MRDDSRIIAGAGGCQIIDAAGTYAVSAGTLIPGVYMIKVVTGVNEGITALETMPKNGSSATLAALHNIIDANLSALNGEILTFADPISTITVAASQVLIAYAG